MTGFIAAERNHDRQRIAFFERCYARLEFAKGNFERSQEWGIKAKESFYRLGMKSEMAQMEEFNALQFNALNKLNYGHILQ